MAFDPDPDLTNPDTQLIIVSKPEDFLDAELEVAVTDLDVIENGIERTFEWTVARVMTRTRKMVGQMSSKEIVENQIIDEKAVALVERMLDCRERLAGLKGKKEKIIRMA